MNRFLPNPTGWRLRLKLALFRLEWRCITLKRRWLNHLRQRRAARGPVSEQMEFPDLMMTARKR